VHLFFGCRGEQDFLFQAQLQQFLADRTLTSLDVAMSRVQEHKVYVTHKLRARGAELARLILNEGAYIYVCGDGNCMAKDVNSTLLEIFKSHGEMGEAEAADLIATLKIKRRYSQDIWS
jgi:sulfite reductase (NADPH) flavoprotein alpha-component